MTCKPINNTCCTNGLLWMRQTTQMHAYSRVRSRDVGSPGSQNDIGIELTWVGIPVADKNNATWSIRGIWVSHQRYPGEMIFRIKPPCCSNCHIRVIVSDYEPMHSVVTFAEQICGRRNWHFGMHRRALYIEIPPSAPPFNDLFISGWNASLTEFHRRQSLRSVCVPYCRCTHHVMKHVSVILARVWMWTRWNPH